MAFSLVVGASDLSHAITTWMAWFSLFSELHRVSLDWQGQFTEQTISFFCLKGCTNGRFSHKMTYFISLDLLQIPLFQPTRGANHPCKPQVCRSPKKQGIWIAGFYIRAD